MFLMWRKNLFAAEIESLLKGKVTPIFNSISASEWSNSVSSCFKVSHFLHSPLCSHPYWFQSCVGGLLCWYSQIQVLRQSVESQRINIGGRSAPRKHPNDWPGLLARVLKFLKLLAILRSHRWNNFICNACSKFGAFFITEWGMGYVGPIHFHTFKFTFYH